MAVPAFNQFLQDMGEDYRRNLIALALGDKETVEFNMKNMLATSFTFTQQMLGDYHAWLVKQLSQDGV